MGASSALRLIRVAALAGAAINGLPADISAGGGGGAAAAVDAAVRRVLVAEGGDGLSSGVVAVYCIVSVILVAVSGLMAGLVLGLLSLDKVDLEVAKRTGNARQRWLVERVEPFTLNPHWTMCALVVVNAACNTALPLFIDRLLNPLAAILISVTAILIFAEIAPQAVCKRYGLEIGAYCSWLVRFLMVVTAPVSWPLGKTLDWLLGEESALFRRQELKALVGIHAETQHDGSVGALTSDEVQVIQGALDMASKTAESVMTPLSKVLMLSSEAVIDKGLLATVIKAGHSRVPVYDGDNRQAITGILLVKDLLLVDETAGIRIKELKLREVPFLRVDVPLYDVMKIFRFGRKHMACLTRVAGEPSTGKASALRVGTLFRRASPQLALAAGQQVEEVVGICTIEDVLEELLQTEIVDETDQYEDNMQTQLAAPQVPLRDLPPNLRRFLSPRRSLHSSGMAAVAASARSSMERERASSAASSPALGSSALSAAADGAEEGNGVNGVGNGISMQRSLSAGLPASQPSPVSSPPRLHGRAGSASSIASAGARSVSHTSLGAAAAASALMVGAQDAPKVAAGVAAGIRAAELQSEQRQAAQQAQQAVQQPLNIGGNPPALRPALPPGLPRSVAPSSGRGTPEFGGRLTPDAGHGYPHPEGQLGGGGDVAIELGEIHLTTTTEGADASQPLVSPGRRAS